MAAWYAARALLTAVTVGRALPLIVPCELELKLFRGPAITVVAARLVITPRLGCQACPMATMKLLLRLARCSRALNLPPSLQATAIGVAVALFVTAVALRVPLLDHSGAIVGAVLCVVLAPAFAGGTL